jgi:hypothetical protein
MYFAQKEAAIACWNWALVKARQLKVTHGSERRSLFGAGEARKKISQTCFRPREVMNARRADADQKGKSPF